jgi:hypothetical protein
MLRVRSAKSGLKEADHLYLDFMGRGSYNGSLVGRRGQLFGDEDLAELYCPNNCWDRVLPRRVATALLLQAYYPKLLASTR